MLKVIPVLGRELTPKVNQAIGVEVGFQQSPSLLGVALFNGVKDRHVLVHAAVVVQLKVATKVPHAIVVRLRVVDDSPDAFVSANQDHLAVIGVIGRKESGIVLVADSALLVSDDCLELLETVGSDHLDRVSHRAAFESRSDHQRLVYLPEVDRRNNSANLMVDVDEPFLGKPDESLSHGGSTDAQPQREFLL